MLYVLDGFIYTEKALYKKLRLSARKQLDLVKYNVHELQSDNPPDVDAYVALNTASESGGLWYRDYSVRSYTAEELQEAKDNATKAVVDLYQKKVDELTEFYPAFEQGTWAWQYEEALALQADPQASSPIIDKVVQWSEGFTKAQYVTYLLNNIPVYKNVAGKYIGLLADAKLSIKNATTKSEIDAVVNGVLQL